MPHPSLDDAKAKLEWTERKGEDPMFKLKLTTDFRDYLKRVAKNHGVSLSQYMRFCLAEKSGYVHPENREEDTKD